MTVEEITSRLTILADEIVDTADAADCEGTIPVAVILSSVVAAVAGGYLLPVALAVVSNQQEHLLSQLAETDRAIARERAESN